MMSKKSRRTVNQTKIIEVVSKELSIPEELVSKVIYAEQQTTLLYLRNNYKVIKRGYMTLTPIVKSEYELTSHFDKQTYHIPSQPLVRVRLGRTLLEDLKK